jgi:arylsulfatase A-like enzyme
MLQYKQLLLVVFVASFAACTADPRPSILFISIDTLRADRLGAYGYSVPTSPALDALAARSIVFEKAFVQEPRTLTSHISMMTSLYPDVHGVDDDRPLEESVTTLAEVLKDHGYATQAFTGAAWVRPEFGLGQGFDGYEHDRRMEPMLEQIFQWLEQHHESPFFLFLHGYEVHSRGAAPLYRAPPPFHGRFSKEIQAPLRECAGAVACYKQRFDDGLLEAADRSLISATYDEGVAYADELVGRVLRLVDELEIDERLIIVFTSDHGEGLLDHQGWSHGALYDEVIRVPLFLKLPGDRYPGRRIPWLTESVDLAPTLLGLVGLPIPGSFQGFDLSSRLGEAVGPRRMVDSWRAKGPPSSMARTVRTDRWKLIRYLDHTELFDLSVDPLEKTDLAPARPGKVAELQKLMRGPVPQARAISTEFLDAETERELRALGYLP